jgi:GNAT superfamily N-acetyltransferase
LQPVSNELLTKLKPKEWLTIVGDVDRLMPSGQTGLKVLVDELFMLADIAALEQSPDDIEACLVSDPARIAAFNASGEISAFQPNDRSFLFAVVVDGSVAATARYGVAADGDIVVDRVSTAPTFRRRGLARRVMTALACRAPRSSPRGTDFQRPGRTALSQPGLSACRARAGVRDGGARTSLQALVPAMPRRSHPSRPAA